MGNATRLQRDAFDRNFGLALVTSRASYIVCLSHLRSVYAPFETSIAALGEWPDSGIDLRVRRKVPKLDTDLLALGVRRPDLIADRASVPSFESHATALGWLLVMEMVAIRAQVIDRWLKNALDIGAENGGAFVHGYGGQAGSMWRSLDEAAERLDTGDAFRDKVVFGSIAAFNTLLICADEVAALMRQDGSAPTFEGLE